MIKNKIIILGIDGMDFNMTKELINQNKLPNFKKLKSFLKLNSSYPPETPVAWSCIATGLNPAENNIFDFIRRDIKSYTPLLSLAKNNGFKYENYLKSKTYWDILSENNIYTKVTRWPVTFPANKINGTMISGQGVVDIKGFMNGYSFYTNKKLKIENSFSNNSIFLKEEEKEKNIFKSFIYGPKIKKIGNLVDIKIPIKILKFKNNIELEIDDNKNNNNNNNKIKIKLNEWSKWININFKIGFGRSQNGIFKIYLNSLNPLEIYFTSIQIDPKKPIFNISYPKNYSKELAENIGNFYTLGIPEETNGYIDNKINKLGFKKHIEEIETERKKMFWFDFNEFQKQKKGVLSFIFDSSDRVQHIFYKNNKISKEIEEYFIEKDKFIGEILKKIDNQTGLFILSDHGFTSFNKAVNINTWLYENKYLFLKKEIAKIDEFDSGSLFKYVDWKRTKAYSLGFNSLYINEIGREGKGIIKKDEKEKLLNEIKKKLLLWIDNSNINENNKETKNENNKVISNIYLKEEIYEGKYIKESPDMIIGFNKGYRMDWESPIGGFTTKSIYNNTRKWKGDHLVDPKFVPAVLFSNLPLKFKEAELIDIAPTILKLFDLENSNLKGNVLLK